MVVPNLLYLHLAGDLGERSRAKGKGEKKRCVQERERERDRETEQERNKEQEISSCGSSVGPADGDLIPGSRLES